MMGITREHSISAVGLIFALGCAPAGPPAPSPLPERSDQPELFEQRRPLVQAIGPNGEPGIASELLPERCGFELASPPRADCRQRFARSAVAASNSADTARAMDGDTCTGWRPDFGGATPPSITFDFGEPVRIDVLSLLAQMPQDQLVSSELAVSDDGVRFQSSQIVGAPMQDRVALELRLPTPVTARFFRLTTNRSGSQLSWQEIGLFACGVP